MPTSNRRHHAPFHTPVEPLEVRRLYAAADPVLSEFLAQNTAGRTDEDGKFSDWVEIHNPGTVALNLSGYYLTDDATNLTQWQIPAGVSLAPGGYQLVWASGENRQNPAAPLHTNFSLKAEGEYLGLVKPDGTSIASDYAPAFPAQSQNVSYGVAPGGKRSFFTTPTPGAANTTTVAALVAVPQFSHQRGFYNAPFSLTLRTDTAGASIRYTTDGAAPTATSGTLYTGPINVSTTRNVRAAAFKEGSTPSAVATQTYLFLDSVIRQPASISGFPNTMEDVNGGSVPADTEMDPGIVNSPAYSGVIKTALTSIPSLSITTGVNDIFGPGGFYDTNAERPVSIELIDPARPGNNAQINGAAEAHSHDRLKRSMRISFKETYGPTKWRTDLLKDAPLNGDTANGELDNLVLRAGNNRAWTRLSNPDATTFTEDQWYRDSQIAMSGYGAHGTYVHLYLNGVYWGLYNVAERPDANWQAETFGGQEEDYFATNQDQENAGNASRWDHLVNTLINRDLSGSTNYNELRQYLDVEDFADYLILNWYQAQTDWPQNNYNLGNRNGAAPTPTRFFAWDGEWSWDRGLRTTVNGAWVHPAFREGSTDNNVIPRIWRAVSQNADFRTLFADRVALHTGPGGALSPEKSVARFDALNAYVRDAVVAESARWGDALESLGHPTRTRDGDWQREVNNIRSLMGANDTRFVTALRSEDYYPSVDPATFNQRGGTVPPGFNLVLSSGTAGATIYYTTDGSDPRLSGGGISSRARAYTGPIALNASGTVRTRVHTGSAWSAESAGTFSVSAFSALRVTELMYNPAPPPAPATTDGDEFEFIRLKNTGSTPLDLAGIRLAGAVQFTFGNMTLGAGQTITLVENPAAFVSRYGAGAAVAGQYTEKLDDGGEVVQLIDKSGNKILDFAYDDAWYPNETDGQGHSLVIVDPMAPAAAWGLKGSWRPSPTAGGTIGMPDDPTPPPPPPPPATENQPPTVTVAGPATVVLNTTASVSATVTDDGLPPGGTTSLVWSKVSGPGDVTFAAPTAASTGVTFTAAGTYVLRATATDGASDAAAELTITVQSTGEPNPPPPPPPNPDPDPQAPANAVTRFVLVDARTGQDLMTLADGDTINLAALPTKRLTVRADVAGAETASVRFGFDRKAGKFKPIFRVESTRPLALFGSKKGKYKPGSLSKGTHTLQATPFTGTRAGGAQGAGLTVRFTVVNIPAAKAPGRGR